MAVEIAKIPGGFSVDGVRLMKGKCGCTSIVKCCYSWSKVKVKGKNVVEFEATLSDPDTKDNFEWGYTVEKDGVTVVVNVSDARDKVISAAHLPPHHSVWEERGWRVLERTAEREDGPVWRCAMCKWLFRGDREGKSFESLPDDWTCPRCGVPKRDFEFIG